MLTIAQAADRMQVSQSLLYRLVADGSIECYRIGKNAIRFNWDRHIVPYLEGSEVPQKKPKAKRPSGKKATLKHLDLN